MLRRGVRVYAVVVVSLLKRGEMTALLPERRRLPSLQHTQFIPSCAGSREHSPLNLRLVTSICP